MKTATLTQKNFQKNSNDPLIIRLANYIESEKYDTTYLTHGVHSYPGKYIPQLPNLIISEHTNERNTILDPFCGCGTTLLEACILGRKSIGIDSNPIATLISKAKTTAISKKDISKAKSLIKEIQSYKEIPKADPGFVPQVSNLNHWFQENVINDLAWIKAFIWKVKSKKLKLFLKCIFSSIIVSVSNQESDTRYAAKDKNIKDGYTIKRFVNKFTKEIDNIEELSLLRTAQKNNPRVYTMDLSSVNKSFIDDNSIDLVVTSPPYPNSYDYYLYHKLRMYWLNYDYKEVRNKEIGSRNEHSSRKAPIDAYIKKMIPAVKNVSRMLKPSKLAYFFIGDAIISGELINISNVMCEIAKECDLKFITETQYSLENITRSFHEKKHSSNKNKLEKMQRILVFEGINGSSKSYPSTRKIATPKASRTQISLEGQIPDKSIISIASDDYDRHIHSLGKYPSKFIPEIPRWAIRHYSTQGDLILDPFCGAGTTAVEALILSRNVISADFSPYACLLTEAKTTKTTEKLLLKEQEKLLDVLSKPNKLPKCNRLNFDYDDFWFNTKYLEQIESIRIYIENEISKKLKNFFLAILSSVIKPCSYLDASQIKVKRDPKKVLSGTPPPISLMGNNIPKFVNQLVEFNSLLGDDSSSSVILDTAKRINDHVSKESVDLIVTSPPYINAMNYPMTHRYENILLRMIEFDENISHQTGYYGTERVYAKDYSNLHQFDSSWTCSEYLNPRLEKIFDREPKRSLIVYNYFENMAVALQGLIGCLRTGGKFVIVVGSNVIRGVKIDTFELLKSILLDLGMKYINSFQYEIVKHSFKLRRHETANLIKLDGVMVLEK